MEGVTGNRRKKSRKSQRETYNVLQAKVFSMS
jgi:hypothetical protein